MAEWKFEIFLKWKFLYQKWKNSSRLHSNRLAAIAKNCQFLRWKSKLYFVDFLRRFP
jgi:hypothetical protein